jgi:hypothetical protein
VSVCGGRRRADVSSGPAEVVDSEHFTAVGERRVQMLAQWAAVGVVCVRRAASAMAKRAAKVSLRRRAVQHEIHVQASTTENGQRQE